MCTKCKKMHAAGVVACESQRDVAQLLSDIERGVGESRDGLKTVTGQLSAYEARS